MKKVIVLLALVAAGALVFAEDAPAPTYEFSANATGGWKYNLDTELSTFINDWDFSLKYHLLNDIKKTKGADEGTYGWIEVSHINLNLIEETEGNGNDAAAWGDGAGDGKGDNIGITAKIVSGPIEVGLYGAPGNNYDNAKYVPLFEKDAGYADAPGGDLGASTRDSGFKPQLTRDKGLSLKYTIGTFGYVQALAMNKAGAVASSTTTAATTTIVVGTGTEAVVAGTTYYDANGVVDVAPLVANAVYTKVVAASTTTTAAVDPQYLFGVNVQVKPVATDALTVTIDGGFQTNLETSDMILTAKAAVAAGALSASVAFDGGKSPDASDILQWDAAANVTYKLFEAKDSVQLDVYALQLTDESDFLVTDLGLKFVDAEGLVPGLSFTLGAFWFDFLDNFGYDPKAISVAESISYKYALSDTTYVKPYQALRYDLDDVTFDDAVMYLNLGVEAQLFPNTVLTVDYYKGQKNKDNNENLVKLADDSEFAIKAKVSL